MNSVLQPSQRYSRCHWFNAALPNHTPDMLACGDFPNEIQKLYSIVSNHGQEGRPIAELIRETPPRTYSERFDKVAYDDLSPKIKEHVDALDLLFKRLKDAAATEGIIAEGHLKDTIDQARRHVAAMRKIQDALPT